jgi:hypothetical protein
MTAALARFGWECGPEFWKRYDADPWVYHLANAVERLTAEIERLRAQQGPVSDDVIRDLVAAAAGLSEGANPTAAGRFADALRRELAARGLEITPAHPTGGTT